MSNQGQFNPSIPTFQKDPSVPLTAKDAANAGIQNSNRQNALVNPGATKGGNKKRTQKYRTLRKKNKRSIVKSKKAKRYYKITNCKKCYNKKYCKRHTMRGGVAPPPPGKMLAPEGPSASYTGANQANNQSQQAIQANINAQRAAQGDNVGLVQKQSGGKRKYYKK